MKTVHVKTLEPLTEQETAVEYSSKLAGKDKCNFCEFIATSEKDMAPHIMSEHIRTLKPIPVTVHENQEKSPSTILDMLNNKTLSNKWALANKLYLKTPGLREARY